MYKRQVQDAIGNAKHNGGKNARFFAADATRWISEAAAAGERADVIFMDPPREGSTPQDVYKRQTVQFNIEYKAMFGEQIVVNIQTEEGELKLPLETTDGERWVCDWCLNHQKNRIPIIIV